MRGVTRSIQPAPSVVNFDFPRLVAAAMDRELPTALPPLPSAAASPPPPPSSPQIKPVPMADDPFLMSLEPELYSPKNSIAQQADQTILGYKVSPIPKTTPNEDFCLSSFQRKKIRMKAHRQLNRAKATTPISRAVKTKTIHKYVLPAVARPVEFDASDMKHTKFAWTGGNDSHSYKKIFSLDEMVGPESLFKFTLQRWSGISPVPITDHDDRIIAVLAGRPDDESWQKVHQEAADALESSRYKLKNPSKKDLENWERRGHFPQQSAGESMGGGQTVPGTLQSTSQIVFDYILTLTCFLRIAGFQSNAFALWAPNLFNYYSTQLGEFYKHYPDLKRNFYNSIFACCTFNFGPFTVCFDHTDPGNLPFGWCAIIALGKFDPKRGGHLILWDLHLVLEFPPGSTILIPSASLRHGNTSIQPGETRYSFTQYTAGGIFRWVEQGYQKTLNWYNGLSKEQKDMHVQMGHERWAQGISLFSKLSSLVQGHDSDSAE